MDERTQSSSEKETARHNGGSRRGFLLGAVTGLVVGGLLAGGATVYSSLAHGPGGFFPRRHGFHASDPATVMKRVSFVTDWILSEINATDDQKQKIKALVGKTMAELRPLGEEHHQNRQAMMGILLQPTVDRDALNSIRHSEMALAEGASTLLLNGVAAAAEVLTLEQRQELASLARKMHR